MLHKFVSAVDIHALHAISEGQSASALVLQVATTSIPLTADTVMTSALLQETMLAAASNMKQAVHQVTYLNLYIALPC